MTITYRVLRCERPVGEADLLASLKAYLGPLASTVYGMHTPHEAPDYFALLQGEPCNPAKPLAREGGLDPNAGLLPARWFNVWLLPDEVQVIMRQPDEATHALARGFAEFVARYWGGQLETP